ncbi:NUDIX domain-containing protein [Caulobacter segnis]|uniref:NUDIX domain-containing protein n=1 Tax=Caulobacter segnis TaxID=88688 RepID=UPI00240FC3C0|nr:NUDIX domain-containing protein [Caulobacter segnis]MDG2523632.1 NUDIX domain-containing protein [Caulobacter segnis]
MSWRRRIEPFTRPLFKVFSRATRSMTLGVRGLVVNEAGWILLVEHTYLPGWYLPGGGVERGETAEAALAREMEEEAGVRLEGRPRLLSFHSNDHAFSGDHVLIYRIDRWSPCPLTSRGEIAAVEWFDPENLPDAVTPATRARIMEALGKVEPDLRW